MRPALSFGTTPNELIRHCFLRRPVESLLPRFWRECRLLAAFSLNLRILLANSETLKCSLSYRLFEGSQALKRPL